MKDEETVLSDVESISGISCSSSSSVFLAEADAHHSTDLASSPALAPLLLASTSTSTPALNVKMKPRSIYEFADRITKDEQVSITI